MTGRQRSKLAMFIGIQSVCSQYRYAWRDLPAFANAFERFQTELNALSTAAKTQRRHTGGAAQEKVRIRFELCALAFEVAAAVRASALAAGDEKSAGKLAFSITQLRIGKDAICLERCRQILTTAEGQLPDVESFGITQQKLAALGTLLERFAKSADETRIIRADNKGLTEQLPPLFKAVEHILYNQLDNLIPQFRTSAPRFFAEYHDARIMRPAAELPAVVAAPDMAEEQPLLD